MATSGEVVAVSMVRDEADIVASTFGRLLGQVDRIVVADNGSIDGTGEILRDLGIEVLEDPEIAYHQAEKMTTLAHRVREEGASWIVPVDADELWVSTDGRTLRDVLADVGPDMHIVRAELVHHVATALDSDDADPIARMQWRLPDPAPLPKVACRSGADLRIAQGNHSAQYDNAVGAVDGLLRVHHYSYRSPEQLLRKVRNGAEAYAATNLPEDMGAHWRQWGRMLDEEGPAAIEAIFWKWWWREDPETEVVIDGELQPALVHDPCVLP